VGDTSGHVLLAVRTVNDHDGWPYDLPRWRGEHDRVTELSVVESGPDMMASSEHVLEKYRQVTGLQVDTSQRVIAPALET
jgi:hypothetical protein